MICLFRRLGHYRTLGALALPLPLESKSGLKLVLNPPGLDRGDVSRPDGITAFPEAHKFEPIAVEPMEVYGRSTGVILRAIGRRLVETTGEPREDNWFRQNLL